MEIYQQELIRDLNSSPSPQHHRAAQGLTSPYVSSFLVQLPTRNSAISPSSTRISETWISQQQPRSRTKQDGITVPVLAQFVIARGEKATTDQLTLNQALITCAATVEAGSEEDRPNLGRVMFASQQAGGAAGPRPHGRGAQREARFGAGHGRLPMGMHGKRRPALSGELCVFPVRHARTCGGPSLSTRQQQQRRPPTLFPSRFEYNQSRKYVARKTSELCNLSAANHQRIEKYNQSEPKACLAKDERTVQ